MKKISYLLVFTTVPNKELADSIANECVISGIAACVQITPTKSVYMWEGQVETTTEQLLKVKLTEKNYNTLETIILRMHPYDTPEIIAIPISHGNIAYLSWINEVTK
ncbi:divalent cation tolerance protein CutA [Agarivorans sp. B2Z047]|uniref:divalent-cation tolerance protein CutA n=1 Tax=Agarivorans sp. B2Z047 TaxID=2652721 RepID=UPI00128E93E8|nr:divalent-cation tolerance protein CutA [Agarivorans sp. B2Z047]MPW31857.1 divalent cation tolerance protein CutA [Agarivorans sp. B2Z047]UQN43703.1 divalent-cation tolerance protein CutA [Agarivorans sp. B2Z047]